MATAPAEVSEPTARDGIGPGAIRQTVKCRICNHLLFDGNVVRSRVVRMLPRGGAEAMCRCKNWFAVPLTYQAMPLDNLPAKNKVVPIKA